MKFQMFEIFSIGLLSGWLGWTGKKRTYTSEISQGDIGGIDNFLVSWAKKVVMV